MGDYGLTMGGLGIVLPQKDNELEEENNLNLEINGLWFRMIR